MTSTTLTTHEAAADIRKSVFTVRRIIGAGLVTATRVGRDYLIDRESWAAMKRRATRKARAR
jgi:excisionase family DNA binding protein